MGIIHHRFITYIISGTLFIASAAAFLAWGLNPGIDFTGGTLMEIEYAGARPSVKDLRAQLIDTGVPNPIIQPTEERGFFIRAEHISEDLHQQILRRLEVGSERLEAGSGKLAADPVEKRFDTIGPTIGQELARRSMLSIALVILLIVLYIAFAFRKVSEPVASWKYGVATIIALVHDVAIPVGIFAVLGRFYSVEVDTLFVTALLTILGFSVHDTIVVFDRIRENLKNARSLKPFEEVVGESISQTITRSINTSLTVLLVLLAVYFFGGASIQMFALTLIVGIIFGTYSSICLASPLLVAWEKLSGKK